MPMRTRMCKEVHAFSGRRYSIPPLLLAKICSTLNPSLTNVSPNIFSWIMRPWDNVSPCNPSLTKGGADIMLG
jgi:hypothetical protein